jgi:hypothetical protein
MIIPSNISNNLFFQESMKMQKMQKMQKIQKSKIALTTIFLNNKDKILNSEDFMKNIEKGLQEGVLDENFIFYFKTKEGVMQEYNLNFLKHIIQDEKDRKDVEIILKEFLKILGQCTQIFFDSILENFVKSKTILDKNSLKSVGNRIIKTLFLCGINAHWLFLGNIEELFPDKLCYLEFLEEKKDIIFVLVSLLQYNFYSSIYDLDFDNKQLLKLASFLKNFARIL